jgi:hypothetical protein
MLYRTLPDYYPADSAYAKFPFLVPPFLKDHLAKLPNSPINEYIWSRPPLPKGSMIVSAYRDAGRILADEKAFQAGYDRNIHNITNGIALHKSTVRHVYALNHCLSAYTSRFNSFYFLSHIFEPGCNTSGISQGP